MDFVFYSARLVSRGSLQFINSCEEKRQDVEPASRDRWTTTILKRWINNVSIFLAYFGPNVLPLSSDLYLDRFAPFANHYMNCSVAMARPQASVDHRDGVENSSYRFDRRVLLS